MNKARSFVVLAIATALVAAGGHTSASASMRAWWMLVGSGAVAALVSRTALARIILGLVAIATLAVAFADGSAVAAVSALVAAAAFGSTAYAAGTWKPTVRYESSQPGNAWSAIDRGDDPTL